MKFDEKFAAAIGGGKQAMSGADADVTVTVTPLGETKGVYLTRVTAEGFEVRENGGGRATVKFAWIAVGRRTDVVESDVPSEVLDPSFDDKVQRFTVPEHAPDTVPRGYMWWDGTRMRYDVPPPRQLPAEGNFVPTRPK